MKRSEHVKQIRELISRKADELFQQAGCGDPPSLKGYNYIHSRLTILVLRHVDFLNKKNLNDGDVRKVEKMLWSDFLLSFDRFNRFVRGEEEE